MLRATTACNFSWPAGSAPAALASLLFDPPEPQIIGKTQCFATFSVSRRSYLFAHLHLLSSDLFSSDSSHLCFSTVHIVGSFTSKLRSNICLFMYLCICMAFNGLNSTFLAIISRFCMFLPRRIPPFLSGHRPQEPGPRGHCGVPRLPSRAQVATLRGQQRCRSGEHAG